MKKNWIVGFLSCVMVAGGSVAAELAEQRKVSEPLAGVVEQLGAYVKTQAAEDRFSGTVLLSYKGETIYDVAFGLASKRFNVPNVIETKLNLGSMNKMFTSVAILQLMEQGKIRLDDRLGKYLDESWLPRNISDKIQIRHLLTHASGLGSYFNDRFWQSSKLAFKALDDYKPLIAGETLQFEPGTDYRYSNTGMFLLGVVIEQVSGQDYFSYIRDHIYAPAGMENSDCYEMNQPVENLAIGYSPNAENETGWENNLYLHVVKGGPAGGCFSTVEDLNRFAIALTGFKLLSAENTVLLYTPKSEFHDEPYGYGFRLDGKTDNRIIGHGGGFPGISANLDIFIDAGFVAAVLSNYGGAARPIRDKIRELVGEVKMPN